jgi:Rha family phage regulatory protein
MQDFELILFDVSDVNGVPMTTSRRVAARFGKTPSVVNRAIRALVETEEGPCNFAPSSYTNAQGKTQPEYLISKDGFCLLAMGFTGPDALAWKRLYIKAFNRMAEEIATAARVPAVPVTLHERIVAWEQLDSATYSAAKGGSSDMNKRKRALKVLRPEAALIAEEQQPDMFAIKG